MKKHSLTILIVLAIAAIGYYFYLNSPTQKNKRAAAKMTAEQLAGKLSLAGLGIAGDLLQDYTKDELLALANKNNIELYQ